MKKTLCSLAAAMLVATAGLAFAKDKAGTAATADAAAATTVDAKAKKGGVDKIDGKAGKVAAKVERKIAKTTAQGLKDGSLVNGKAGLKFPDKFDPGAPANAANAECQWTQNCCPATGPPCCGTSTTNNCGGSASATGTQ